MSIWIFWFGVVLMIAGGLSASYVWFGKILGIVKKERAKKIWIAGTVLSVIGIILVFVPIILGTLPEDTEAMEKVAESWLPFLWIAIAIILIGTIPTGLAQYRILDSISVETTIKTFKIGFVITTVGSIMLLWVMMLGHMLPLPEKETIEKPKEVSVQEVLNKHQNWLMAIPGVVGVGISERDSRPVIVVMVKEKVAAEFKAIIPSFLEGFEVKVEVTGEIQPLRV